MQRLKFVAIMLCFFLGMSLVMTSSKPSIRTSKGIKEDVIDEISLKTYQHVRQTVVFARGVLQEELKDEQKTLYLSSNAPKWRTQQPIFSNLKEEIDRCLKKLDKESSLFIDLFTTKLLLEIAVEYRDLQAMVDAYNILSDLEDFFFYYNRNEIYYGVTQTLSGKVDFKTVNFDEYIEIYPAIHF